MKFATSTALTRRFKLSLAIAIVGALTLAIPAASHATTKSGGGGADPNTLDAVCYLKTYPAAQRARCVANAAKLQAKKIKANKAKRAAENTEQQVAAIPVAAPSLNPPDVVTLIVASTPKLAPEPLGDIIVTTYLDSPKVKKPKDEDYRIGRIPITITRDGGNAGCSTHSSGKGNTIGIKHKKDRNGNVVIVKGHPVLIKGIINFNNCNVGSYTVTAQPRDGYTIVSDASKSFVLNDGENHHTHFVLKKIKKQPVVKKKPVNTTGGTSTP